MCHFITATAPKNVDFAPLSASRLVRPLPLSGPAARLARDDEQYLLLTAGHCDCGTVLGSREEGAPSMAEERAAKWRKKGWSETKIARALRDSEMVSIRQGHAREAASERRLPEAEAWVALLQEAVRAYGRFGLLLHWYSGSPGDEPTSAEEEEVPIDRVDAEWILRMREDVVYRFVPGEAGRGRPRPTHRGEGVP